mmetsp:Transcript_34545/g.32929  ORF Transcript_34545/g.32929 Transcript_34545/m.32929 type:complete len:266 (-) Transcript_34545:29-826(-)
MSQSKLFAHCADFDVVLVLAFIGGFVDAAGFIKITGVFTSSITGNLVVACASVNTLEGVICRACVSIAFAAAAGVSATITQNLKLARLFTLPYLSLVLFSLEISMLVATWAVGVHLNDRINASIDLDDWFVVLVGSMLGASMGFHNVAAKESITGCPPTTVMTSTLINISCSGANTLGFILASFNIMRLTPPTGPKGTYLPLTTEESHAFSLKAYAEFQKFIPLIRKSFIFWTRCLIALIQGYFRPLKYTPKIQNTPWLLLRPLF